MMDPGWLKTCITAGEFLYGEYPVSVLQKLYGTKGESYQCTGDHGEFR